MKILNSFLLSLSLLINSHYSYAYANMPSMKANKHIEKYFNNLSKIDLKKIFVNELKDKISPKEYNTIKNSKFNLETRYDKGDHYVSWKINNQLLLHFSVNIDKQEFKNLITKKKLPLSSQKDIVMVKKDLLSNLENMKITKRNMIGPLDLIFFNDAHAMFEYALMFLFSLIIDLFSIPIQHILYFEGSLVEWIERHLELSDDICCELTDRFLEDIKKGNLKTKTCEESAAKLSEKLVNFSSGRTNKIDPISDKTMIARAIDELKKDLNTLEPSSQTVFNGFFSDHFYTDKLEDLLDEDMVVKSLHSMFNKCNKSSMVVKTGEDWNFYSLYDSLSSDEFNYKTKEMPKIEIEHSAKCRNMYKEKEDEIQNGLISMSRDLHCNKKLDSAYDEYRNSVIRIEDSAPNKSLNWSKRSIKEKTDSFLNWTKVLARPSTKDK